MQHLVNQLKEMGFSQKEARIYLASLELGEAAIQDIASRAGVSRASTYLVIEALKARGLVCLLEEGKKKLYCATPPSALEDLIEKESHVIEKKKKRLGKIMPMLFALMNAESERPHIQYLEGPEGIRTMREMFLEMDGEVLQMVPLEDAERIEPIKEGRDAHLEKMATAGMTSRALLIGDPESMKSLPVFPGSTIRMISKEEFPVHGEITVRGNTVFLYAFKDSLMAVVITNQQIADALRTLFELAWKGSKEYPEKSAQI